MIEGLNTAQWSSSTDFKDVTQMRGIGQTAVNPEFLKLGNILSIFLFCTSVTARTFETRAIPLSISTPQKGEQ